MCVCARVWSIIFFWIENWKVNKKSITLHFLKIVLNVGLDWLIFFFIKIHQIFSIIVCYTDNKPWYWTMEMDWLNQTKNERDFASFYSSSMLATHNTILFKRKYISYHRLWSFKTKQNKKIETSSIIQIKPLDRQQLCHFNRCLLTSFQLEIFCMIVNFWIFIEYSSSMINVILIFKENICFPFGSDFFFIFR